MCATPSVRPGAECPAVAAGFPARASSTRVPTTFPRTPAKLRRSPRPGSIPGRRPGFGGASGPCRFGSGCGTGVIKVAVKGRRAKTWIMQEPLALEVPGAFLGSILRLSLSGIALSRPLATLASLHDPSDSRSCKSWTTSAAAAGSCGAWSLPLRASMRQSINDVVDRELVRFVG